MKGHGLDVITAMLSVPTLSIMSGCRRRGLTALRLLNILTAWYMELTAKRLLWIKQRLAQLIQLSLMFMP